MLPWMKSEPAAGAPVRYELFDQRLLQMIRLNPIPLIVFATNMAFVFSGCSNPRPAKPVSDVPYNLRSSEARPATQSVPTSPATAWQIPPRSKAILDSLADMEELNKEFRSTYATERQRVQETLDTVVLLRFSGATLLRNGQPVETARVIPDEYHNLRYASHVPFTLFLKLNPRVDIDPSLKQELLAYVERIRRARSALAKTGLNEVQITRQTRIFDGTEAYVSEVIRDGRVYPIKLKTYARSMSLDIEENMREAGAAQVEGLYQQLLIWRARLTQEEWQRVRFIVRGPQQPRGGNAATLLLSAITSDPGDGRGYIGESRRVIYREDTSLPPSTQPSTDTTPSWAADIQLLAAIVLDAAASQALFSDPDRLAVDIAADGARARIQQLDLSELRITSK